MKQSNCMCTLTQQIFVTLFREADFTIIETDGWGGNAKIMIVLNTESSCITYLIHLRKGMHVMWIFLFIAHTCKETHLLNLRENDANQATAMHIHRNNDVCTLHLFPWLYSNSLFMATAKYMFSLPVLSSRISKCLSCWRWHFALSYFCKWISAVPCRYKPFTLFGSIFSACVQFSTAWSYG